MLIEIQIKKYILANARIAQTQSEKTENLTTNIQDFRGVNIEQKDGMTIETSIRIYCLELERGKSEKALVKKLSKEVETGIIVHESSDFGTDKLTYESSDENIAMVDQNGNVIGISEGEARITVSNGTLTDWCTAFVKKREGGSSTVEGEPVFEIEVSSILNTGWTQNTVVKEGSLEGYTISYKVSDKIPTYDKRDEYLSSNSSNVISDKASDTTYFVWAIATKGDISVCSNNCIRLRTGHTHIGSEKVGGKCYELTSKTKICPNTSGYVVIPPELFSDGKIMSITNNFNKWCEICRRILTKGDEFIAHGYNVSGTANAYAYIQCIDCGAKVKRLNRSLCVCNKHSKNTYSLNYRNRYC